MTVPATGWPDAGTRAPLRTFDWRVQARGIGGLLAAGLALRLILAYLLPGSGFAVDIQAFQYWANNLAQSGPLGFYNRGFFVDYTPGYLYVLWIVGAAGQLFGNLDFLIKVPPILADLALGWLIWRMVLDLGGSSKRALLAAAIYLFNPITWFDSVVWGQVDSFGVVFLLLGLRELWRDRPERSAIWAVVAAIIKPQLGILVPIVAAVVIRRYYFDWRSRRNAEASTAAGGLAVDGAAASDDATSAAPIVRADATGPAADGARGAELATGHSDRTSWERRERGPVRVLTTAITGLLTATILCLPFGMTIVDLASQVVSTASGYPYLTVNAYNPWALLSMDGNGLAANGLWVRDLTGPTAADIGYTFGPIPAVLVGSLLLILVVVAVAVMVARNPDRLTILVGLTILGIAFFVVPTRVHERYMFPVFALGAILLAFSRRWSALYVALGIATFLNMYVVLTTLYPNNPGISDWLGIGPDIRSETTVSLIALLNLVGFLWALIQLRPRARARLAAEVARGAQFVRGRGSMARAGLGRAALAGAGAGSMAAGAAGAAGAIGAAGGMRRDLPAAAMAVGPSGPGGAGSAPASAGALVPMTAGAGLAGAALAADAGGGAGPIAWRPDPRLTGGLGDSPDSDDSDDSGAWAPRAPDDPSLWPTIKRAVFARPLWPDRSKVLASEPRGRLDRMDLWLFVVLIIGTLTLRTFRLGDPEMMHFDEVYHARTATEFLQFWRYGIPHDIYEYTHPHVAKYMMAAGLVALGDNQVTSQGDLDVTVRDAAIEGRWDDATLPDGRAGDRLYIATGTEVRAYDLQSRELIATVPVAGAVALAVDESAHTLWIGTSTGELLSMDTATDFDQLRVGANPSTIPPPADVTSLGAAVQNMVVTSDGAQVLAVTAGDSVVSVDSSSGAVVGRTHLPGVTSLIAAGTSQQVVADPKLVVNPSAMATILIQFLGGGSADVASKLLRTGDQVVLGPVPSGSALTGLNQAIAAGTLPGVSIATLPEVAAVDTVGLDFISPSDGAVVDTLPLQGATGGALVTGLGDDLIYVATGTKIQVVDLTSDTTPGTPFVSTVIQAPGAVKDVTFDPSTNFVHVLGTTQDGTSPTIYVVEPHGNAIYADAKLPFEPVAWATDAAPLYPSVDRQQIDVFGADGSTASVDIGNNPFAWRLPGVILGALTAGFLYLLARILFRRRSIGILSAIFVAVDGMTFVQSRIGMNDVYVGFFIVVAYTLFAALWYGAWRGRVAFWFGLPTVGILLGLALASKWVGLYAMAGIGILILARSALGRLVIILAMIGATTFLGYLGLTEVPGATSGGNLVFMILMIALTLIAVLVSVLHPIEWSPEEVWFAIGSPIAGGLLLLGLAVPLGATDAGITVSSIKFSVLTIAGGLVALGGVVAAGFWLAGKLGFGPRARAIPADSPRAPAAAAPAAEGWLRLGSGYGIPAAWIIFSIALLPIVVYVISYLPWVALGNRLTDAWPPGNHGQTLVQLTKEMYDYHNDLRAAHPASSPWWAWLFDLKPVWFYQQSFAGDTSASIYDAGNLVVWWIGVPAMAFCSWQAWKRRSLALSLIVMGYIWQWLPWVRIDRATFQYHYYTALPFLIVGLAYFMAELWHGASKRTWLLARVSAALAIIGPVLLWVAKGPLCAFVRVDSVNPGSQACTGNPGDLVVTAKVAGVVLVMVIALGVLIWQLFRLQRPTPGSRSGGGTSGGLGGVGGALGGLGGLALTAGIAIVGVVAANAILGGDVVLDIQGFQSSYLAVLLGIPLVFVAAFVLTARDARRFVAGLVFAAVMEFLVFYPNLSALPLPAAIVNAYQGVLPTYLYPFQFPVNTDPAAPVPKFLAPEPIALLLAITLTCLVVGYAAWVWRVGPPRDPDRPGDGLTPTGGA